MFGALLGMMMMMIVLPVAPHHISTFAFAMTLSNVARVIGARWASLPLLHSHILTPVPGLGTVDSTKIATGMRLGTGCMLVAIVATQPFWTWILQRNKTSSDSSNGPLQLPFDGSVYIVELLLLYILNVTAYVCHKYADHLSGLLKKGQIIRLGLLLLCVLAGSVVNLVLWSGRVASTSPTSVQTLEKLNELTRFNAIHDKAEPLVQVDTLHSLISSKDDLAEPALQLFYENAKNISKIGAKELDEFREVRFGLLKSWTATLDEHGGWRCVSGDLAVGRFLVLGYAHLVLKIVSRLGVYGYVLWQRVKYSRCVPSHNFPKKTEVHLGVALAFLIVSGAVLYPHHDASRAQSWSILHAMLYYHFATDFVRPMVWHERYEKKKKMLKELKVRDIDSFAEKECAICLEVFELRDLDRCVELPCRHIFHCYCVMTSLESKMQAKCPYCNQLVFPEATPKANEQERLLAARAQQIQDEEIDVLPDVNFLPGPDHMYGSPQDFKYYMDQVHSFSSAEALGGKDATERNRRYTAQGKAWTEAQLLDLATYCRDHPTAAWKTRVQDPDLVHGFSESLLASSKLTGHRRERETQLVETPPEHDEAPPNKKRRVE